MMPQIDMDIWLNQVAQGIHPLAEIVSSFDGWPDDEKRAVLRRANALVLQAGAGASDVALAIAQSGVRRTRTAPVVLTKGRLDIQLAKISNLPAAELRDGLMLAISLLAIADGRRRNTKCASGCTHWWHKNLSDDVFVARVRRGQVP